MGRWLGDTKDSLSVSFQKTIHDDMRSNDAFEGRRLRTTRTFFSAKPILDQETAGRAGAWLLSRAFLVMLDLVLDTRLDVLRVRSLASLVWKEKDISPAKLSRFVTDEKKKTQDNG